MKYKIINMVLIIVSVIIYFVGLFIIPFNYTTGNYELGKIYILAIPCITVFLYSLMVLEKKEKKKLLYLFLLSYAVALLGFVFASRANSATISGIITREYNIIPFKSVVNLLVNHPWGIANAIYNILGNFLMLVPLAILLPLISDKFKKWYVFLIVVILISSVIEITQYFTNIGSLDVDDFILNVSGAFIFYLIINNTKVNKLVNKIFIDNFIDKKYIKIIYKIFIFISVVVLSYSIYEISYEYYSNKIDISNLKCINNEKTYLGKYGNFKYYSACDYGTSVIYQGGVPYKLDEFNLSTLDDSYLDKLNKSKEEVIKNVKINYKDNYKKLVYENLNTNEKIYLINMEDIIYEIDNKEYSIDYILHNDIEVSPNDILSLSKINYGNTLFVGDYYNGVLCQNDLYYIPINFDIKADICSVLREM